MPYLLVEPLVLVPELLIDLDVGLAHGVQNVGARSAPGRP